MAEIRKGNIRQRSKGSWALTIDTGQKGPDGKRQVVYETIKGTEKDAVKRLRELQVDLAKGQYAPASKLTLGAWLNEWLTSTIRPMRRVQTAERYRIIIDKHISPALGTIQLSKVTALDVQRFINGLLETHSPATIKLTHLVLSGALKEAVRLGLIQVNPAGNMRLPTQKRFEVKIPEADSVKAILDLARQSGDRLYPALFLAARTGMRRGEIMGLEWKNVNLMERRLVVETSLVGKAGRMLIQPPKTEKGRRNIDLDDATIAVLEAHRALQDSERVDLGPDYEDKGRVFADKVGGWTNPDKLLLALKKYGAMVGCPTINVHSLRHFHISVMLQNKTNVVVVSARAGHSSPSFTYSRYAHSLPGAQREAVDAFASFMGDDSSVGNPLADRPQEANIRHNV